MISLGSCTMKLNATSEMIPISWPEFARLHPFAPIDQAQGYMEMIGGLEGWLKTITGFDAISMQSRITSYNVCYTKLLRGGCQQSVGRGGMTMKVSDEHGKVSIREKTKSGMIAQRPFSTFGIEKADRPSERYHTSHHQSHLNHMASL